MRREICGECDTPINDDGSCGCTVLLKRGWRLCAKGQKATQWCAMTETLLREQRQRDETLLRRALDALLGQRGEPDWYTGMKREDAIAVLRERLGEKA